MLYADPLLCELATARCNVILLLPGAEPFESRGLPVLTMCCLVLSMTLMTLCNAAELDRANAWEAQTMPLKPRVGDEVKQLTRNLTIALLWLDDTICSV